MKNFIVHTPQSINTKLVWYFEEAIINSERSEFLHPLTFSTLSGLRLFKLRGVDAGFALKPDGDIVSVHNNSGARGLTGQLLTEAIAQGGTKLDHFDGKLSELFGKYFPVVTAVDPWNPEYAPEGWKYERVKTTRECLLGLTLDQIRQVWKNYNAGKPSVIYRTRKIAA